MLDGVRRPMDAPFELESPARLFAAAAAAAGRRLPDMPDARRVSTSAGRVRCDVRGRLRDRRYPRARTSGEAVGSYVGVVRAEQQVVAGMNYRMCLDVTIAGNPARVLAIVYCRDLKGASGR